MQRLSVVFLLKVQCFVNNILLYPLKLKNAQNATILASVCERFPGRMFEDDDKKLQ